MNNSSYICTVKIILPTSYNSEEEFYLKVIKIYDIVLDWNLSITQTKILVYLIRFGYNKRCFDMIKEKLKMTDGSLKTNLSYLRKGRVSGKKEKKIAKLIKIAPNNNNMSLLIQELKDIKDLVGNCKIKDFKDRWQTKKDSLGDGLYLEFVKDDVKFTNT